ncbi:MAG: DUF2892 domain-containing protein [Pseudobdellovibrionaceae bacterium]
MKQNVGTADRIIRLVAGVILLSLTVILEGDVRWIGLIGIVPILTAAAGFCPMYCPLNVDTTSCCGPKNESCCAKDGSSAAPKSGSCCGGGGSGPSESVDTGPTS